MNPNTATSKQTESLRPTDSAERHAYLTLALIPGLGARRVAGLLSRFGSATGVLAASRQELFTVPGLGRAAACAILKPPHEEAERLVARATDTGHITLVPSDSGYPARLRSIPDPPVVLFAVGRLDALVPAGVAIVGSRDHSRYGARIAAELGRVAAEAGIPVISGMARGLDAVAQQAALDARGLSIGVLGTGADIVYPLENRALFERMGVEGLLITEHPPGDRGGRGAFPRRNRLISGLARALVVIEAAEASGTLVTVGSALEQGREVLVVPGPIDSPTSRGTNRLLRDGATPLLSAADMLALFDVTIRAAPEPAVRQAPCNLSPEEARTLAVLSGDGRSVDEVATAAGFPVGLVLATLLGLELGGLAEQMPDNSFRRR